MKINSIVIFLLVTVIGILVVLLQHYYGAYLRFKKNSDVARQRPVFEDMIQTQVKRTYNLDSEHESELLNSLNEALKFSISETTKNPTIIPHKSKQYTCDAEVYNSLQAAMAFKLSGKMDKAMKLFQHAASMAPDNADVLNHYGEFLELVNNDVVAADELYFKALANAPHHEGALTNRLRTADMVDKLDLKLFRSIDQKRDLLKDVQETNPFYNIMKKQAYYLHIYHTVGIEGNTLTLEQLRYVLETGKAVAGKSIVEHNEILGLELAMQYVRILTRFPYISVNDILGIHRRVLGHVDPINCGKFRDEQVFIGSHIPPSPGDLPALMQSYVEWLNSDEAKTMHPVRYAALAHYKLVDIHPFSDGNGRTSRLIMNLILIRAGYPPIMILKNHREKYYNYLNVANKGDVRPFVRFIAYCTENMLDVYLWSIQRFSNRLANLNIPSIEMDDSNREF